jgi:hypothetical protein
MKCLDPPNVQEAENALQSGCLAAALRYITKRKKLRLLTALDAIGFYLVSPGYRNSKWVS